MNECSLNNMVIIRGKHCPVGASDDCPFNVPALTLNQRAELNTHLFVLQMLLAWGHVLLVFLSAVAQKAFIFYALNNASSQ